MFVAALRASKNAACAMPKWAVVLGFHYRRVSISNFSPSHWRVSAHLLVFRMSQEPSRGSLSQVI